MAQVIATVPGAVRDLAGRGQGEISAVAIPLERQIIVMAAAAAAAVGAAEEPGDGGGRPR